MAVVFFHFVSKGYGLLVEKIWSAERYGPPKWVYNHNLWTVVGYLMMSGCCIVNMQCFIPLVLRVATSPFTSQFRPVRSQLRLFQLSQLSPLAMQHRKFALQLVSFASRLRLLTSQLRLFAPSPFLLLEAYFGRYQQSNPGNTNYIITKKENTVGVAICSEQSSELLNSHI